MITMEALVAAVAGLDPRDVEGWIASDWVRPAGGRGAWLFREIDVARVHLIRSLTIDLGLRDDALPVVLRLVDQLYDERRRLRRLRDALDRTVPDDLRQAVLHALREPVVD